jgi:hypothetical protein
VLPVDDAMNLLTTLAGPMHAVLRRQGSGVWAFSWNRPSGVHQLDLAATPATIGGWAATSVAGTPVTSGPEQDWHVATNGTAGYVVAQDYWTRPLGRYEVGVSLSAGTPVDVQVSNAADGDLLAQRQVPGTDGVDEVTIPLDLDEHLPRQDTYSGWGPFRLAQVPPAQSGDDVVEIRVWTPAGGQASVYSLSLVPVMPASSSTP